MYHGSEGDIGNTLASGQILCDCAASSGRAFRSVLGTLSRTNIRTDAGGAAGPEDRQHPSLHLFHYIRINVPAVACCGDSSTRGPPPVANKQEDSDGAGEARVVQSKDGAPWHCHRQAGVSDMDVHATILSRMDTLIAAFPVHPARPCQHPQIDALGFTLHFRCLTSSRLLLPTSGVAHVAFSSRSCQQKAGTSLSDTIIREGG